MKNVSKAVRVWLVFMIMTSWTGCGGGGGESAVDLQSAQVKAVVDQENADATEFASQAISYFDAVEEYLKLIEDETGGIDLSGMTVDDLINLLGQEQVDVLADAAASLYSRSIVPSAQAMYAAYNALEASEKAYGDILNLNQTAGMMQPAEFVTAAVVCAAGGVLLAGVGTIAYCVNEFIKENQTCVKGYMDKGYEENVAGLACTLQNPEAIKKCGLDVAVTAYTTPLSLGAAGYKKIQLAIDAFSAYDAGGKIKTLIGERWGGSTQGFGIQIGNDSTIGVAAAPNPDAAFFIGTSEEGTFLVPEGDWKFMAVADGYARGLTGRVSVSGSEDIIQEKVTMVPGDEAAELVDDYDADGFTICDEDCNDDDASVYPGANEICDDGIDNDCNLLIDCDDSQCGLDAACQGGASQAIVNVVVDIPGHGTFAPDFKMAALGTCSSSSEFFPTIYAGSGGVNPDPLNDDVLSIALNNDLGIGTWDLATGPCETPEIFFSTKDILDEGFVWPVGFSSYSGFITLEEYGTQYGDRLKGSFSVQVQGSQRLCPTPECDVDRDITGTISGSFDGIITDYTPQN